MRVWHDSRLGLENSCNKSSSKSSEEERCVTLEQGGLASACSRSIDIRGSRSLGRGDRASHGSTSRGGRCLRLFPRSSSSGTRATCCLSLSCSVGGGGSHARDRARRDSHRHQIQITIQGGAAGSWEVGAGSRGCFGTDGVRRSIDGANAGVVAVQQTMSVMTNVQGVDNHQHTNLRPGRPGSWWFWDRRSG